MPTTKITPTGPAEPRAPSLGARLTAGITARPPQKVSSREVRKLGKDKQRHRINELKTQLNDICALDPISRAAAVQAAQAAASHACLVHNSTAEQALEVAKLVAAALSALACIDVRVSTPPALHAEPNTLFFDLYANDDDDDFP
eukprot:7748409-Karenia_brevis.AAC.1